MAWKQVTGSESQSKDQERMAENFMNAVIYQRAMSPWLMMMNFTINLPTNQSVNQSVNLCNSVSLSVTRPVHILTHRNDYEFGSFTNYSYTFIAITYFIEKTYKTNY